MDQVRASDAEREAAAGVLRAAAAEGRLETEELEGRLATAYAARTRGELTALLADLPRETPRPAPRRVRKPPRIPGRIGFSERWRAPAQRPEAMLDALQYIAPPLRSHGYDLVQRTPDRLVFRRRRHPAWTLAGAGVFFPFGPFAPLFEGGGVVHLQLLSH